MKTKHTQEKAGELTDADFRGNDYYLDEPEGERDMKDADTKAKHTQGEWKSHYDNNSNIFTIETIKRLPIGSIYPKGQAGEELANAKLIAAAPALLEALKEVINCNSIQLPEDIHIEVANAIKQATE